MSLNHAWIAAHIPHQGVMCLLDEVLGWDASAIRCRTGSHRLSTNPLRSENQLRAVCGIEYAAQAIAVHGAVIALQTNSSPARGMLASARSVIMHVNRLDDIDSDLIVTGERACGDDSALAYEFKIESDLKVLLCGRVTISLRFPTIEAVGKVFSD